MPSKYAKMGKKKDLFQTLNTGLHQQKEMNFKASTCKLNAHGIC